MISQFNKQNVNSLAQEVQAAMEALAAKHGLKFVRKSGKFSSNMFSPKFEFVTMSEGGLADTEELRNLKSIMKINGMDAELILNTTLNHPTQGDFKLVGFKSRSPKRPFVISMKGKTFVCDEHMINSALSKVGIALPKFF